MDLKDRQLESLDARLREAEAAKPSSSAPQENEGLRAGIELIGSTVGGGVLGYALDTLFDTRPLFLLVFLCLGIAAGFLSVWKITQGIGTGVGFAPLHKGKKGAKQLPGQDLKDGP